ncbi:hypothetical protein TSHO111613_17450 [Tsukamurella hominis]
MNHPFPTTDRQRLHMAKLQLSNLGLWIIDQVRLLNDPLATSLDHTGPSAELSGQALNALASELLLGPPARASQGYGLDATVEDLTSYFRFKNAIERTGGPLLDGALIVGEEALDAEWAAAAAAPAGTIVINVDPIDGSSNQDVTGENFSVNMQLFVKTAVGMHFQLLLDIVVASSGRTLATMLTGDAMSVYLRQGRHSFIGPLANPLHPAPRPGYVAAVAMTPRHRARIEAILATEPAEYWDLPPHRTGGKDYPHPCPSVHTMGGAPATVQLASYRLAAMVTTSPQTIHDSAGVPALLALGLHAYDVNGPVDRAAIIRRFNALQPPHQPGYKPIPAMAIGRDENFVRKIAEQVLHEQLRPDLRIVD